MITYTCLILGWIVMGLISVANRIVEDYNTLHDYRLVLGGVATGLFIASLLSQLLK